MWYAASRHAVLGLRLRPRVTGSYAHATGDTRLCSCHAYARYISVYNSAQPARELVADLVL